MLDDCASSNRSNLLAALRRFQGEGRRLDADSDAAIRRIDEDGGRQFRVRMRELFKNRSPLAGALGIKPIQKRLQRIRLMEVAFERQICPGVQNRKPPAAAFSIRSRSRGSGTSRLSTLSRSSQQQGRYVAAARHGEKLGANAFLCRYIIEEGAAQPMLRKFIGDLILNIFMRQRPLDAAPRAGSRHCSAVPPTS